MTAAEFIELQSGKKKSKYRNVKTEVDGIKFDSQAEARRFTELRHRLDAGEIQHLTLQHKYPISVNGMKICTYIADFLYLDVKRGEHVVEDVKGVLTPMYRMKKKLMKAVHGIDIVEV
jgi:hypothetical protein